jgi:hypothetical protein
VLAVRHTAGLLLRVRDLVREEVEAERIVGLYWPAPKWMSFPVAYALAPTAPAACADAGPVCTRTAERSAPSEPSKRSRTSPRKGAPLDVAALSSNPAVAVLTSPPLSALPPPPPPPAACREIRWVRLPRPGAVPDARSLGAWVLAPDASVLSAIVSPC